MTQIKATQPVLPTTASALQETTTASALQEKSKLQRHFRRFDVFFYLICTVVTIDTIGAVASHGAQGFTWLVFLEVFFFLPYALSVAELGSAFPQEGGPYVWTRLAFGRRLAAVNSVIRIAAWRPRPSGRGGNAASPPRKCQWYPIVCSHVPVPAAPHPRPAGGAAATVFGLIF